MHDTMTIAAVFDKESNYIAYCCQVQFYTYVKHSLKVLLSDGTRKHKQTACLFKAPSRLVDKSGFTEDDLVKIQRDYPAVNHDHNKAISVGLRHIHDISITLTKAKEPAMVYYTKMRRQIGHTHVETSCLRG